MCRLMGFGGFDGVNNIRVVVGGVILRSVLFIMYVMWMYDECCHIDIMNPFSDNYLLSVRITCLNYPYVKDVCCCVFIRMIECIS